MHNLLIETALAASLMAIFTGCSTAPKACESESSAAYEYVPIAQYTNHFAHWRLEDLHRIQINDIAGLRNNLETNLAMDVRMVWTLIQYDRTSKEDRQHAYRFLRLIAVQNEKYPISLWNGDAEIIAIFRAAIENDGTHTELLRRQDWSKPKWINWVK